ncbi:hypothetical protein [Allofournierella sp.]|uniref:hypothetical protein n=1 Tax=Allofournierella sp. TaxID=1940256 RepID=UPI003AB3952A
MRKSKLLPAAGICLAAVVGGILLFTRMAGQKPFKGLEPGDITSAFVRLSPPDRTVQITDLEELASYLDAVVIYHEDNSYTQYAGQAVTFAITLADGTQTEIMAYNPFLVIDGVGYKTQYGPCEALNAYANRLLDKNL